MVIADGGFQANLDMVRAFGISPAPEKLLPFKVLDSQGSGYTSDVIEAIDLAVQYKRLVGIDIINLSLGHPIYEPAATDPLVQAVERATAAGIVVVASAGNHGTNRETGEIGYAGITSPGNAPSALTIGSVNTAGHLTRSDETVSRVQLARANVE